MRKLLHIIATPRGEESRTLRISKVFLENFQEKFSRCETEELNVTQETLPQISVKEIGGKYVLLSGKALSEEFKSYWKKIEEYINQFLSADFYLISTPMWNFSIPYYLKHYIDVIVQPQYLFRYSENGPEGLAKNKKMVIITSRGGDYSGEAKPYDFQEPYLRTVFWVCWHKRDNFYQCSTNGCLRRRYAERKNRRGKKKSAGNCLDNFFRRGGEKR